MRSKIISYGHALLTVLLAVFFINAGIKKFVPRDPRPVDQAQLIEQVIVKQTYEAPVGYTVTMNTMRQSGFLKMIGVFQLLAALLMLIPRTRLVGIVILMPIIFNIFFMHVFMDNRLHENVETGILLGINVVLLLFYYKRLLYLFTSKMPAVY